MKHNSIFGSKHSIFAAVFALLLMSNFSRAQNPTIITDSLVVTNRVYAKEKLIVDQLALFKQDIKVNGSARIQTDFRVDMDLRVDGTAKFNGHVKMTNLEQAVNMNVSNEFLIRLPSGQVQAINKGAVLNAMYAFPCGQVIDGFPAPVVTNPVWNNGPNKIFASFCEDVKVGIGTNDPTYILDVTSMAFLSQLKTGAKDAIQNAMINGFDITNSRDLIQLGVHNALTSNVSDVNFKIRHDGSIMAKNYGGKSLELTNLGNSTALRINNNSTGKAIEVMASNGTNIFELGNDGTLFWRNNGGSGFVAINTAGVEIMKIGDDGIVYAKEIIVKVPPFPDYVFEEDYNLIPLEEVKNYVEKNKHLPGIPAANHFASVGLSVGDMQVKQMEKIEDIYLYLFEMNDKIANLEEENKKLKSQMDSLSFLVNMGK